MNFPRKTWLFTPAFCKWELLQDLLQHIYRDAPYDINHVIIDNHFPINKEQNRSQIKKLCEEYKCTYVDSGKDRGLHGGLNNAMSAVGVSRGDVIIGCDPDDRPTPGWVDALRKTMDLDPTIGVLGLNFWVIDQRFTEGKVHERMMGPHSVWYHPTVEMWNVAAFSSNLILDIGGFGQTYAYYGGIESYLYSHMTPRKLKLAYLKNYRSDAGNPNPDRSNLLLFDPRYRVYKDDHIASKFSGSFEEWLSKNGFAIRRVIDQS